MPHQKINPRKKDIQASLPVPTVTDVQPKTNDDMWVGMKTAKVEKTQSGN